MNKPKKEKVYIFKWDEFGCFPYFIALLVFLLLLELIDKWA